VHKPTTNYLLSHVSSRRSIQWRRSSGEETTEDATEQQEEDATTAADDKWIHSAAKKPLRTDIILGKVTASSDPKDVYAMHNSYKGYPFKNFKTIQDDFPNALKSFQVGGVTLRL
jgi:exopolysaccharide biosynthesis protein